MKTNNVSKARQLWDRVKHDYNQVDPAIVEAIEIAFLHYDVESLHNLFCDVGEDQIAEVLNETEH
jgi:hypothetical protein